MSEALEVVDSTSEEVYATIPAGTPADIDRAVAAAKAGFAAWSERPPPSAASSCRVAEELEARRDEIAEVITHEVGMPKPLTADQVGSGISGVLQRRRFASTYSFEDDSEGLIVNEPVGIVGCITPWNYPLNQIGEGHVRARRRCTVVLKPSEVAPVNPLILAEILDDRFPARRVQPRQRRGPRRGRSAGCGPDVDMVSLTGRRVGAPRVGARGTDDEEGRGRAGW